jgi:hypothetical protein
MSHAKNKVNWCLNKARKEGKQHRGLVKADANLEKAREHVAKAGDSMTKLCFA